mmetsp:Transcript_1097/g.2261  ORF Transcript_1097/g.2261 Transcript_1097/m.2261 type:complete len:182 (-) Transcript_1097:28-573(-)
MSQLPETQIKSVNVFCVDCNHRIEDIPKKRVDFNFMRCKACYKKSVTFICQYPFCKQKLKSHAVKFCLTHTIKSKAEKKEALARAAEEERRKRLELPDPFQDSWRFPQSALFQSGGDLFEIYTVLDITPNFTKTTLRAAYKQKARELHPDKNEQDTTEQFQNLQVVYKQALALLGEKENSN